MVPRILYLHPKTYKRLIRLRKQAERDGAYRVAKRLQAVVLNSEGRTSGELAHLLGSPRSRVSEWLAHYQAFGVEGLLEGHRSGRPLELTSAQRKQLDDILESGPVAYGLDTGIWTSPMIAWVSTRKTSGEFDLGAALQCGIRIETAREPTTQSLLLSVPAMVR
jgi:transposase